MTDTPDNTRDQLREVFIGRQPILDKNQTLIGYKLLFHDTRKNHAGATNAAAATADVVSKAFAELGLADVFGQVRAFIKIEGEFVASNFVELLPLETVVLEIATESFPDDALLERCRELKRLGYAFALSGVTDISDGAWPLIDLATWIMVDLDAIAADGLQAIARTLATTRRKLIATHVESQAQMELCRVLGFELFQGSYFAEPVLLEGRKLDASMQGLLRLIKLLAEEADLGRLDAAFRSEPALVINLLRLTNSVGAGLRARITSVRHAITALGRNQLRRWLHLLIFRRGAELDFARNPLLQLAALRGRFMELLVDRLHAGDSRLRDPAFLTGLMSVVPAALHMSMTDVLAQIAVDHDVRLALSHKQGTLGTLLALTESYDDNDIDAVQALLAPFGSNAPMSMLGEILAEALTWVQELGNEAG
ncbi:MAG: HDOD domain-containing protein [Rhodocyclales bacterium]|nr:HDOD domain-containing protein [Rhodocyclales bacterium]